MSETFRIEIVASARAAEAGIARVDDRLESLNRTAASTNSLLKGALQVAGIGSTALLVQRAAAALVEYADGYTLVQNQLAIVTHGTQQLATVTEELLGISNRSRTGFEETAKLYARTALATRELGTSQTELLGITETVNKAIILSGASTKEASNGLIQLSQAISSNRLAGDELRSVLEQLPVVADIIAKQLGVTRGELREMGKDGEITAKVIIDAFKNARQEIEAKFAKTIPTVSQGFQVLRNNIIVTIGELNKATGVSQLLAAAMAGLGRNLKETALLGLAIGAAFAAGPLIRFVQTAVEAAAAQRALRLETEAAISSGAAQALNAENQAAGEFQLASAAAARTQAQIRALEVQQASAVVAANGTKFALQQAEADLVAAGAAVTLARSQVRLAEVESVRLNLLSDGLGDTVALTRANETLAVETNALAAAQERLAVTTVAATQAEIGQAAARAELAGLQGTLVAQSDEVIAAQQRLNTATAASSGILGRLAQFVATNPYGVLAVGVGVLAAAFVDWNAELGLARDGVTLLGEFTFELLRKIRGLAEAIPTVGKGLAQMTNAAIVGGLAVAALAVTNPFVATAAAVAALVLGLGALKRAYAETLEAEQALGEIANIAPIGNEIVGVERGLRTLKAQYAELQQQLESGNTPAGLKQTIDAFDRTGVAIELANKKLAELAAKAKELQSTDKQPRQVTTAFDKEIAKLNEEARLLGLVRRERENGIEAQRIEQRILKEGKGTKLEPEQRAEILRLVERNRTLEDQARILEELRGPEEQFKRTLAELKALEKDGTISTNELSGALNKLFAARVSIDPLEALRRDLKQGLEDVQGPTIALTGDPAKDLKKLQDANREMQVQVELQRDLVALKEQGKSDKEVAAAAPEIANLIRQRVETERLNALMEQQLELKRDLADQKQLALLPDFDQNIESQILALRDLNLTATDQAARIGEIQRNAALEDLGGILNGLQEPSLALAQQQAEVARQIGEANAQFAAGNLTVAQYNTLLAELNFRAQELSTSFGDGFVVALKQATASMTEATVGQTALTSAINAAGSATSEFVQSGTVDFRKYALNIIAEITRVITQMLILRAISAAFGGIGGQAGEVPGGISPDEFAGNFRADGGPVKHDEPYVVGERGPEVFVPGRSGSIIPNDQVVGAMANASRNGPVVVPAPNVTVPVNITQVTDPDEVKNYLRSDEGGRDIMTQLQRNPEGVRRAGGR